jgi:hypothetical protein
MAQLWFKAKRYRWGWTPVSIEGWIVVAIFVGLVVAGALVFASQLRAGADPRRAWVLFALWIAVVAGAFIAFCYAKGEKPRWRLGAVGARRAIPGARVKPVRQRAVPTSSPSAVQDLTRAG